MEPNPLKPLSQAAQEQLDAVYDFKMRLFRGLMSHMIYEDVDVSEPQAASIQYYRSGEPEQHQD